MYYNHLIVFADPGIGLVEAVLLVTIPAVTIIVIVLYLYRKRHLP
jgi:cell division protein FtsL